MHLLLLFGPSPVAAPPVSAPVAAQSFRTWTVTSGCTTFAPLTQRAITWETSSMADPIATTNFSAPRGTSRTFPGTHTASATSTTPTDITGWTIKVTARDKTTGEVVLQKTASVVSGTAGTYLWAVTHADTLVTPKVYDLDIQRTDSGAETLMGLGEWTITKEVLY